MARRGKTGRRRFRRWMLILCGLSLAYLFVFGDHGLYAYVKLVQRRNRLAKELARLKEERERLVHDLEKLKRDRAFLEKVAREKYHLGRPGERIYILPSRLD